LEIAARRAEIKAFAAPFDRVKSVIAMVDLGRTSFPDLRPTPTATAVGLATMRLSSLFARGDPEALHRPQRLRNHLLVLVTAGHAAFTVDFTTYVCRPSSLIWVRPGQVIRFPRTEADATLVQFDPSFPASPMGPPPPLEEVTGTYWQPTGEDEDAIVDAVSQLETDHARLRHGEDIPVDLLRHELAALLLRIAPLPPGDRPAPPSRSPAADGRVFQRFRREIEARFAATRQVEDYAATLGCSVRTLTRASLAATGRTAKQLIDDRVALEAKRLLAHSDLPVSAVAGRLGFTEPTNFGRFFVRTCGLSPGQFRAEHRDPSPAES
jgi:AraC-like DNA-binding protein